MHRRRDSARELTVDRAQILSICTVARLSGLDPAGVHIGAGRPVLIKGAIILSQDPAVGDYAAGDILIRDGKIAQVGEDLARQAGEAVIIDAAGTIAVPGFVDAHVHTWEGQLRGAAQARDFGSYLSFTAFGYGPHYRPHDNYVGTLATVLRGQHPAGHLARQRVRVR